MMGTTRYAPHAALILAMSLAGCGQASLEGQSVAAADRAPQRSDALTCVVARLSDGDSFTCADGRQVRLLLIDAPELAQKPWGAMAKRQLEALAAPGTAVRLERDRSPTDRYGRMLAYAWVGTVMINEQMVANGWAVVLAYENVRYLERLLRAERAAQKARKGLWQGWGFRCRPVDFRARRCGTAAR